MRHIAVLVALFAVMVPAGDAAEQAATGKAKLQIVRGATLTLRGIQFHAGEKVKVTVSAPSRLSKRVVAGGQGTFVVRFGISFDRCNTGLQAFAVGSRGSRASVKLPDLMCPPRL
jgi:hypothetical protein